MVLKRTWAYTLASFLLLILSVVFYLDFKELRDFTNAEYSEFKEFVFLLNNVEKRKKLPLTEASIRSVLERYTLELKRISEITNGYEVEVKEVKANILPRIIKDLENYGRIKELEAVDNTGKGRFYLKLKITRS